MGIPIDMGMSIICIAILSPLLLQVTGMKVSPFRSECFSYRFTMGLIIARSIRSVNQNFQRGVKIFCVHPVLNCLGSISLR